MRRCRKIGAEGCLAICPKTGRRRDLRKSWCRERGFGGFEPLRAQELVDYGLPDRSACIREEEVPVLAERLSLDKGHTASGRDEGLLEALGEGGAKK